MMKTGVISPRNTMIATAPGFSIEMDAETGQVVNINDGTPRMFYFRKNKNPSYPKSEFSKSTKKSRNKHKIERQNRKKGRRR